jgi:hypothetical protein
MTKSPKMNPRDNPEAIFGLLAVIGAIIGLGKLLAEDRPITFKVVLGRMIVSAGLGGSAGALMSMFPSADPVLLYGAAAAMASLGTSAVEIMLSRTFKTKDEH